MTEDKLNIANDLDKKIKDLQLFINKAENNWTGKLIQKSTYCIFKVEAYDSSMEAEYYLTTDEKNKMIQVLKDRLRELKLQLESL